MSKGDGGGVSIRFGYHGVPATGAKRPKLVHATELDSHLTQKMVRDKAREFAEELSKRKKKSINRKAKRLAARVASKLNIITYN